MKHAVITGTNRGIGKVILESFAKQGYNVFACTRKKSEECEQEFQRIGDAYGVRIIPVHFDLQDESEVSEGAKYILSQGCNIDVIVNNAGCAGSKWLFPMTKMEDIRKTFQINFFSPMLLTKILLKNMMKNKKGSIIHVSSVAAIDGEPAQFEYVSSKAAIAGATRQMARELAGFGIRVNAVAPGVIDTDMANGMKEEMITKMVDKTALKRMGTAEEIANVILFLASDASSYMTGQIVRIDGGI